MLGLPNAFVRHGDARWQRQALGLDKEGLMRAARELLSK
jgi:1-deoxy-D-xylulose-5-phosphate synthase